MSRVSACSLLRVPFCSKTKCAIICDKLCNDISECFHVGKIHVVLAMQTLGMFLESSPSYLLDSGFLFVE